jgi:hypothetical protein
MCAIRSVATDRRHLRELQALHWEILVEDQGLSDEF